MSQPTNVYSSYDAVGNREDLSDIIYDVSPSETPVLSRMKKGKATATYHEWQTDALRSPSGSNAKIEGDTATTVARTATVRRGNYTQIADDVVRVTGSQEAANSAGRKSEMAYQMARAMKALKTDVESRLLGNYARAAGNDSTAREAAGLQSWIVTNISKAADGTAATGDGTDTYTDGTARAFSEAFVESALASGWTNGATPSMGVMNAFQKRKFAGVSGNATRMSTKDNVASNTVDIYIDPLGTEIKIVPCRQAPTDVVYFLDPEYMEFVTYRPFQQWDLAKDGDSERKQLLVEFTLKVGNEKAHAAVYDLATS